MPRGKHEMHDRQTLRALWRGGGRAARNPVDGLSALVAGAMALTVVGAGAAVSVGPRGLAGVLGEPAPRREASLRATGGNARAGRIAIAQNGCSVCHAIDGFVPQHGSNAGPSLRNFGARADIAGVLPNGPQNLVAWLGRSQAFGARGHKPGMDLRHDTAADIAAYLYRH
ncbi:MAG: hypothetical protein AcusKO_14250 [Acuticoccus sp.]